MLKLAGRWYDRQVISDDITLVYEPHVHPFLRCNIWHVRGRDRDMIIDTGLGAASLKEAIADLLDKPVIAVATHIHYDHVGCLHEFEERVMHRVEAPRMRDYDEFCWLRIDDFPAAFHDELRQEGFDPWLIDAAPSADFDPGAFRIRSTVASREVDEGDVIDLGNRHFEVMHLPGHSPGSMGLWEKGSGTLFSGDALYDGTLLDELPDSSIPDYVATMKRLRELPVSVVHGGHEPSFDRERMIKLCDDYLAWRS